MMKKIFLSILLLGLTSFSQSIESLKASTKKFYDANFLMDFETIVSLSYPKMVETIGKETLLEKVEKFYENEEYRLREQLEIVPFQFGTIQKIEGTSFCVITFRNPLRYFFEVKLTTAIAAEKATWLKETNNTKDVTFEPKRNSFNVRRQTTYVALMDETTTSEWKFINLDDTNQLAAFQTIFSESVKKELGL